MRIPVLAIVTTAAVLTAMPAHAQRYSPGAPICLQTYGIAGNNVDCSFVSLPQCQATASGRPAECYVNPYYAGPPRAPKRRIHRHR